MYSDGVIETTYPDVKIQCNMQPYFLIKHGHPMKLLDMSRQEDGELYDDVYNNNVKAHFINRLMEL